MIETERLILRPWREGEAAAFMAINNEPDVLEWMSELTLEEAEQRVARYNASYEKFGFGRIAAERKSDGVLLGSVGIMHAFETLPIAGKPEVGWRLSRVGARLRRRGRARFAGRCIREARTHPRSGDDQYRQYTLASHGVEAWHGPISRA